VSLPGTAKFRVLDEHCGYCAAGKGCPQFIGMRWQPRRRWRNPLGRPAFQGFPLGQRFPTGLLWRRTYSASHKLSPSWPLIGASTSDRWDSWPALRSRRSNRTSWAWPPSPRASVICFSMPSMVVRPAATQSRPRRVKSPHGLRHSFTTELLGPGVPDVPVFGGCWLGLRKLRPGHLPDLYDKARAIHDRHDLLSRMKWCSTFPSEGPPTPIRSPHSFTSVMLVHVSRLSDRLARFFRTPGRVTM